MLLLNPEAHDRLVSILVSNLLKKEHYDCSIVY